MVLPAEDASLACTTVVSLRRSSSPARGAQLAAALAELQTLGRRAFLGSAVSRGSRLVTTAHTANDARHENKILLRQYLQQRHDGEFEH